VRQSLGYLGEGLPHLNLSSKEYLMTIKQKAEQLRDDKSMVSATISHEAISSKGIFAGWVVRLDDPKLKKVKHVFLPRSEGSYMAYTVNDVDAFSVTVKSYDEEKKSLVVSARAWMKQYVEHQRFVFINELREGDKFSLEIARVARFGLFVNMGLVDGLIHKSNLPKGKELDDYKRGQVVYVEVKSKNVLKQEVQLAFADEKECEHFHVVTAGAHDLKTYLHGFPVGNTDTEALEAQLRKRSDWNRPYSAPK